MILAIALVLGAVAVAVFFGFVYFNEHANSLTRVEHVAIGVTILTVVLVLILLVGNWVGDWFSHSKSRQSP